jgi:hypothetical protein
MTEVPRSAKRPLCYSDSDRNHLKSGDLITGEVAEWLKAAVC